MIWLWWQKKEFLLWPWRLLLLLTKLTNQWDTLKLNFNLQTRRERVCVYVKQNHVRIKFARSSRESWEWERENESEPRTHTLRYTPSGDSDFRSGASDKKEKEGKERRFCQYWWSTSRRWVSKWWEWRKRKRGKRGEAVRKEKRFGKIIERRNRKWRSKKRKEW